MENKITLSQCVQLWWRFAVLITLAVVFTSAMTHILVWLAACLTSFLSLTTSLENPETERYIHPIIFHMAALISIFVFISSQVLVIFFLTNHHKKVRSILFQKSKPQLPYHLQMSNQTATRKKLSQTKTEKL